MLRSVYDTYQPVSARFLCEGGATSWQGLTFDILPLLPIATNTNRPVTRISPSIPGRPFEGNPWTHLEDIPTVHHADDPVEP